MDNPHLTSNITTIHHSYTGFPVPYTVSQTEKYNFYHLVFDNKYLVVHNIVDDYFTLCELDALLMDYQVIEHPIFEERDFSCLLYSLKSTKAILSNFHDTPYFEVRMDLIIEHKTLIK